jgi:hypothetical protein
MLDYEKVKWMIQRKERLHYTDPRFQDDTSDICTALTRDMSETMAFLESCPEEYVVPLKTSRISLAYGLSGLFE